MDSLYRNQIFITGTFLGVVILTLLFTWPGFRALMAKPVIGGVVSSFVLFYTLGIMGAIFLSWLYGGRKTLVLVTIMWNFEILFLISYRDNWEHAVELLNLILFFVLYWIESPSDRRERLLREELAMANMVAMSNKVRRSVERSVAASRNNLQDLELNWESRSRSFIHRLKNRFAQFRDSDLSMRDEDDILLMVYSEVVQPFEQIILDELSKLGEVTGAVDEVMPIAEFHQALLDELPPSVTRSRAYEFLYSDLPEVLSGSRLCLELNVRQFYNEVLYNIITNSARAIAQMRDLMRELEQPYQGIISMDFAASRDAAELMIEISDNGGGFPRDILYEMYVNPVRSSDPNRPGRIGEGTMWVAFYIQLMGGRIQAANYDTEDGLTGARTTIVLPIVRGG